MPCIQECPSVGPCHRPPVNAFLKDCLGCNSIPFQFNEVKFNKTISGTSPPRSSPSPLSVTTPAAASEIIQASGDPRPQRCLWFCITQPRCKLAEATPEAIGKGGLVPSLQVQRAGQEEILGKYAACRDSERSKAGRS